jgi:tRNA-dihydrouridine synthase
MVENVKEDFKSRMINKISLAPMVRMVKFFFLIFNQ